ncbi:DUF397 domain-containing protein [Streptomyces atratus]|uniref:DUF397 domain-containing protein n=1 Tax=Streptomyces atratus TaxID=1893 RepID=A0A2Z5JD94_STRAR|nr:DUF397 domain-containing protein [Streptomyces atratus]AXE78368.1 DUF397 domain-containing protein [Streptomyces atratus]
MGGTGPVGRSRWATSTYSSGDRDCVEVAFVAGMTGIRDSKVAHSPVPATPGDAFAAFLGGAKGSGLDRTV